MTVEFSNLHKILKDSTRRDILQCLNAKGPLSYVELMELARITNTGRLNYHLKILGSLIEKQDDGRYVLTEKGHLAIQLLDKFPDQSVKAHQQKTRSKKLAVTAVILLTCIIVVSSLLVTLYQTQSNFNVTYWKQENGAGPYSNPNTIQYLFNVTGTQETFQLATSDVINHALASYVNKYPFETFTTSNGISVPAWSSEYVHNGQFTFTLFLQNTLTSAQLKSLTQDLKTALKTTQ